MQSISTAAFTDWQCPYCQQPLQQHDNQWLCDNKHSYDQAKEGYINLLLAQHRNSKAPGDNNDMVNARRAFLQSQHYLPMATKLGELLLQHAQKGDIHLFDAGCGEGYYLNQLQSQLHEQQVNSACCGIDISKPAIQKAAKKYKSMHFAVASSYAIPLQSATQTAVIQVFAPSDHAEVHRVLQTKGIWLTVEPAANHLSQLKRLVYDNPKAHQETAPQYPGFQVIDQHRSSFEFTLCSAQERLDLLKMTPFYWRISEPKKQQVMAQLNTVSADFMIRIMRKTE